MHAAILAAGKSTRTYPLTIARPKPLLKAADKTLLEHNLDSLNGIADEVIIIVGYKKEMIKRFFGNKYKKLKIKYIEQRQQLGTGHAASLLEPYISDRFILLMGDNIYSREDMINCMKHRYSILTAKTKHPENFGAVTEENGILADFVEKPKKFASDTISTAMYCLDRKIFDCIKKTRKSKRNEIELPDAVKLLAKGQSVHCVRARRWLPIGYPQDLLKADAILRKSKNLVGKNSKIYGQMLNSNVGDNCTIKGKIKNSIIMDGTLTDKNSIIENSIVGENSNISGKILNAVIADNVKIKNSTIKNCKIWPNKLILNKTISHDVK